MGGKNVLLLFFLLLAFGLRAQSYTYTYTDPCTGVLQSVTINQPAGTVTMFYAGQYQTFTATQLASGGFENWVAQINAQFPPGTNPCAGNGATNTNNFNTQLGNNTAANITNIVGIATSVTGSIGGGGITSTGTSGGSSSNDNGGSSGDQGGSGTNTGGGSTSGGSGTNTGGGSTSGGTTGTGGSGTGGGGGSSGGGNPGSGQEGGVPDQGGSGNTTEPAGGAEQGAVSEGSTTTSSGGDSESSSSGGSGGSKPKSKQEKIGRGSLIGAGDFVVIRNSSDIRDTGQDNFKFNASVTHLNTKQNFIKGVNLNYQTGENIANVTLYGSYKTKGFMGVGSNAVMTNFTSDWFNTTSVLLAQKTGPATWLVGNNFTFGQIGKSDFSNWSLIGGGYTNFKGGKSISVNLMLLGVYSPFIFYYEGQWYKSGVLFIPLSNIDFKLTDKFKWSVSFAGTYQYQAAILNFQLSTGTKILL
jgi:hypothetical protein